MRHPSENVSTDRACFPWSNRSGACQPAVPPPLFPPWSVPPTPAKCVSNDAPSPIPTPRRLARPMSASLPRRCGVTSTFCGLRSRCTMPRQCNA